MMSRINTDALHEVMVACENVVINPPLKQSQMDELAEEIVDEMTAVFDLLTVYIRLQAALKTLEKAAELLKSDVFTITKTASVKVAGVLVQAREGYSVYDYSHDSAWTTLDEAAKAAANERKAREAFLRAIKTGDKIVDTETGEVLYPAVVTGFTKNAVALTFPKV
jgi:hypothetical protein